MATKYGKEAWDYLARRSAKFGARTRLILGIVGAIILFIVIARATGTL